MNHPALYQRLAEHYLSAIRQGSLLVGERMPSLRTLMARHGVSLSTALQLCRHLEERGVLEARPRIGYFVRAGSRLPLQAAREPEVQVPDAAQYSGVHPRVSAIIASTMRVPARISLSCARAAPELYPNEALRHSMQRVLRQDDLLFGQAVAHNGDMRLRAALAHQALAARMVLAPEEILITHGCIEALNLALRAVTQPGDLVAVESPTFFGLLQVLESLGLKTLEIPTSPHSGISLEALQLAADMHPALRALVVVPNLQNPLGCVMSDVNKRALVAWCEAMKIALIEDDTYAMLGSRDEHLSALKSWDHSGNVIHCASLHKSLSPGLRLGWMSAGRWQARVEMLKYAQSRSNETLAQRAVADFIESGHYDRHLRRLRGALNTQRHAHAEAIARHFPEGTRLSVPEGGLSLWVELPDYVSSEKLFYQALEQGIHLTPGCLFSNTRRFEHFLRINCGTPFSSQIDEALCELARLMRSRTHNGQ
ncbi:PLP-dependent aminotransferase family protein [Craterilacuibacter sp. RT1T]|uniref:aminotransferase-like domain-containing protein n=1 Tax=Craterilacuibacter sp. RT1T TaxID=2942211 RepID=UPI0020BD7BBE|nr:PLP-dependent aminotransferase family protein [Craterilacuibacter sp. RT1T]MCL6261915.1 PLP-dependent aminotransferase family protein [Craterilacuibacter sp. RT1T]